jgi:hypothetical protein
MFVAFWSAVKQAYDGYPVFSDRIAEVRGGVRVPESKLMTATVLMIFQDSVLRSLLAYLQNKAVTDRIPLNASLPSADAFREMILNRLEPLKPEFYLGWQLTGFDGSSEPRDQLADAITSVIEGHKTVAKLKSGGHPLFKEKAAK